MYVNVCSAQQRGIPRRLLLGRWWQNAQPPEDSSCARLLNDDAIFNLTAAGMAIPGWSRHKRPPFTQAGTGVALYYLLAD